jgi:hypothetical protein
MLDFVGSEVAAIHPRITTHIKVVPIAKPMLVHHPQIIHPPLYHRPSHRHW